jgi:iron-sulfur cluster assembly protein
MITMSQKAQEHAIKSLKARNKGAGIRLGVTTTGCSGLAYIIEFVDIPQEDDIISKCGDVDVFIDPKSNVYIDGTAVDFIRTGLNEGFVFRNPNVAAECGCGESFTV